MKGAGAIGAGMAAWLSVTAAMADPLPRAASVSVCTDQYLLSLAGPSQVAAVSWQAAAARSPVRHLAGGYPQIRGVAEEIIGAGAGLVIFDPYGHPETARRLEGLGSQVVRLEDAVTVADVQGEVYRIADVLGQPVRGAALAGELERRRRALESLQGGMAPMAPMALYVSPGGGGAGAETYVDEVLRLAGFRNLQAELGYTGWQRVPLEDLVRRPPDVFVMSFFETSDPSLLDGFARHPLFRRMLNETPRIAVPAAAWVCAGPYMLDAAELLAAERRRLFVESAGGGP